jgi:integrase
MSNDKRDRSDYLYRKGPYLYFRFPKALGLKPVSLPPDKTSPEFKRSYDACLAVIEKAPAAPASVTIGQPSDAARVTFIGGTIGAAILRYQASSEYTHELKASTRRKHQQTLRVMLDRIGDLPVSGFDTDAVDLYTEGLVQAFGPSVASRHLFMLSNLYKCARKHPEFNLKGKSNPTIDAVRRYSVKRPTPAWGETAQQKFLETAPEHLIEGYTMLRYGAQRAGDTIKITWEDFDGEGFAVTPEKQGTQGGVPNYHLCVQPLLDMLARIAAKRPMTGPILLNAKGKPWASASDMSEAIRNHLIKIGLAKKGTKTINQHGLRGNAASDVAELLLGTAGIKSVTGHISNQMAEYYARSAEQRAINRKVNESWNELLKERAEKRVQHRRDGLRAVK